MLNFIFGAGKLKVDEKILRQNKIEILNKNDLIVDTRSGLLAVTGSGRFYKGTYHNNPVSVKIVDISKEDNILNEFLYWEMYKNNECFLKFYGVALTGREAYLVFEFFAFTLEYALSQRIIKEDKKANAARQALKILEVLQEEGKKTMDLRPGTLGITDRFKIKLLDFGMLITLDKLINQELVEKQRIKYTPPEYFTHLVEDSTYDIWSFGCILIDIFSKDQPLFKQNFTNEEIDKLHNMGLFPPIPYDINELLRDLIKRCLERDYTKRIRIDELSSNMNIFLDNFTEYDTNHYSNLYGSSSHTASFNGNGTNRIKSNNKQLNNIDEFITELDKIFIQMNNIITDDLMDRTIILKGNVESDHETSIRRLSENYTNLKRDLSEIVQFNIEMIDKFRDKILSNIISMQQYYGIAMSDIVDAQNTISEMKVVVNSLSKFSHPEKYSNMFDSLIKNKKVLEECIDKYSEKGEFDKILKLYNENSMIVEMYKTFTSNRELMLMDIYEAIRKHTDHLVKSSNIKELSRDLKIETKIEEQCEILNNINEIYAKVQENSDLIIIYDIGKKIFHQIKLNEEHPVKEFKAKCYSYYDNETKTIYVSGGLSRKLTSSNFFKIKVSIDFDDFKFEFMQLDSLTFPRAAHGFIRYEDYFFAFGGIGTSSCEMYSISQDKWTAIPELPTNLINPCGVVMKNALYVLGGSGPTTAYSDGIYRMSLNNLDKILNNEKGFEDLLQWEPIDYEFLLAGCRLRRGMGAVLYENTIILFGGLDNDNIYDNVYCINMKPDSSDNNSEIEHNLITIKHADDTLPIKTFFNSNIIQLDNYLILFDAYNNGIEYDLKTNEFYYYT